MPQVWIAIFFILLAGVELYRSIKDITLPFPVYLVLGAVLAVASNYHRPIDFGENKSVKLTEIEEVDPVLSSVQTPLLTAAENSDVSTSRNRKTTN